MAEHMFSKEELEATKGAAGRIVRIVGPVCLLYTSCRERDGKFGYHTLRLDRIRTRMPCGRRESRTWQQLSWWARSLASRGFCP